MYKWRVPQRPQRPRPTVSNVALDEPEAPTLKWKRPAELVDPNEPVEESPDSRENADAVLETGIRKVDIDPALRKAIESGLRPMASREEIERYELREKRETLPAPPEDDRERGE